MLVELHLIQNFAPSCLNRDDTNAPKDCEFGGYRRARISSQCIKRAIRSQFRETDLIPNGYLAYRTKRLIEALVEKLSKAGKGEAEARAVVEAAVRGAGLGIEANGKTQYLLFLGEREIAGFRDVVLRHWDTLVKVTRASEAQAAPKKGTKEEKRESKAAMPDEVKAALDSVMSGGRAVDLALFGRMLADLPDRNIKAACQVAHAISTHKASMEMDFYTAVDDLKPEDTPGADMMGTIEFNSSCFYRYSNIDVKQLVENLEGETSLASQGVEAFLRASVLAIPSGKQTSMAAQNPPSMIFAVVRDNGPAWSLANAFVQPVKPTPDKSLVQNSIEALDRYWGRLVGVYGRGGIKARPICRLDEAELEHLESETVETVDELIAKVKGALPS